MYVYENHYVTFQLPHWLLRDNASTVALFPREYNQPVQWASAATSKFSCSTNSIIGNECKADTGSSLQLCAGMRMHRQYYCRQA